MQLGAMRTRHSFLIRLLGWRRIRFIRRRPIYFSTLRCPHCGKRSFDQMPAHASVFFYDCPRCTQVLKPRNGICCVYCSYGDVPCPPRQRGVYGSTTTRQVYRWPGRSAEVG